MWSMVRLIILSSFIEYFLFQTLCYFIACSRLNLQEQKLILPLPHTWEVHQGRLLQDLISQRTLLPRECIPLVPSPPSHSSAPAHRWPPLADLARTPALRAQYYVWEEGATSTRLCVQHLSGEASLHKERITVLVVVLCLAGTEQFGIV